MASKKKPTPQDAQLILQLYDLRREAVMRKARTFLISEFWPASYDDFKAVSLAFGTEHNAYLRQVITYWETAAIMVLDGIINEDLFFKTNGEPYFLWAKYKAFVPQARKDFDAPDFMMHMEQLANKSPEAKDRVKRLDRRIKARAAQMASAKAGT